MIFYHPGKALSSAFPEIGSIIDLRGDQEILAALTLMPGPMVEATVQLLI